MRFRMIAILVGLAGVAASCGADNPSETGTASAAFAAEAAPLTSTVSSSSTTITTAETTTANATTLAPVPTTPPPTTAASKPVGAPTAAPAPAPAAPETTVPSPPPPPPPPPAAVASGKPCIVSFHGKGGGGQAEWTGSDGVRHSFPAGNASGWGGLQWLYYPESKYQQARSIVANDIAAGGCGRVIVYGFSNGAAFAAKLYCRGETFGGKIVGYVIDDPVVDHAVEGCARAPVKVVLYWTGDIDVPDGWDCGDWTCEGGSAIGIARYEAAIGVARKPSIHSSHQQYIDPPELHSWL